MLTFVEAFSGLIDQWNFNDLWILTRKQFFGWSTRKSKGVFLIKKLVERRMETLT